MTETNELYVIIGVGGGTGGALARMLIGRGKRVRGVTRGGRAGAPSGVEVLKGDATDRGSMRESCQGAAVVYNCVNPTFTNWVEMFPPTMWRR